MRTSSAAMSAVPRVWIEGDVGDPPPVFRRGDPDDQIDATVAVEIAPGVEPHRVEVDTGVANEVRICAGQVDRAALTGPLMTSDPARGGARIAAQRGDHGVVGAVSVEVAGGYGHSRRIVVALGLEHPSKTPRLRNLC